MHSLALLLILTTDFEIKAVSCAHLNYSGQSL